MTYNQPSTIYYKAAQKIEKQIEPLMLELEAETEHLSIDPESGILISTNSEDLEALFNEAE